MFAPEPDVVLANGLVEIAGKKMVDLAIPQIWAGGCVALLNELPHEIQAALAGFCVDKAEECWQVK